MKIRGTDQEQVDSKKRRTETTGLHASAMGNVCTKAKEEAAAPPGGGTRRRLSLAHAQPVEPAKPVQEERGTVAEVAPPRRTLLRDTLAQCDEGPRLSICGQTATKPQGSFESKCEAISDGTVATKYGIGHVCRKGLKPESPNQDDFFVYVLGDVRMFGVFDGHGPCGDDVSYFVQQRLGQLVWEHPDFGTNYTQALTDAFRTMQNQIQESSERGDFDANLSGCTGTLIIHDKTDRKLVAAHVGDSRAVLGEFVEGTWRVKDLTRDHKPTLEDEYARIVNTGGQVKLLAGDIPHRVFVKNKQIPGLAMSRAFGDLVAVQAGVIAVPEVHEYELAPSEEEQPGPILIVCSDGVWEFISSEEAVAMAAKNPGDRAQQSADQLAREAWNRWIHYEGGEVVDDITVEVAHLDYEQ